MQTDRGSPDKVGRRIRHLAVGLGVALVFGAAGAGVSAIGQTDWRVTIVGPGGGEHVYEVTADTEGDAKDAAWAELRAESTASAVPAPSGSCLLYTSDAADEL